jgi:hypothetical protein
MHGGKTLVALPSEIISDDRRLGLHHQSEIVTIHRPQPISLNGPPIATSEGERASKLDAKREEDKMAHLTSAKMVRKTKESWRTYQQVRL